MCHTDDHFVQGDMVWPMPVVGGHEGAGVVTAVGPGVTSLAVGDSVILNFMPICGHCPSCSNGRTRLCDRGQAMGSGLQISDGTSRHHASGEDLRLMCCIGTFARDTVVHEDSCITFDPDISFEVACLMSCGVVTGWGSAVRTGGVQPGDTVAVVGVGGLGFNVVQGARLAGARTSSPSIRSSSSATRPASSVRPTAPHDERGGRSGHRSDRRAMCRRAVVMTIGCR